MIDNGRELTPTEYEELGRSLADSIEEMIEKYFRAKELVTSLQRPFSTFEVLQGNKKRWAQVAISLNLNPLSFIDEDDTSIGKIDASTHNKIIEAICSFNEKILCKFQDNGVPSTLAEMYVDEMEKLIILIRNQLLTINE